MRKRFLFSGIFAFLMLLTPHALAADKKADLSRIFDASAYGDFSGTISSVLSVLGIVIGCAAVAIVIILLVMTKKRSGETGDEDK